MQAMIFAAGMGTRLKPLTDTMPKAMVTVGGQPLIQRVIARLKAAGTTRIVVNVHHFANQIVSYLHDNNNFGVDIRISDETEKLLETGGGCSSPDRGAGFSDGLSRSAEEESAGDTHSAAENGRRRGHSQ